MFMDRKTLLAVALSFLVFVGWQKFYIEPRMPKTSNDPKSAQTQTPIQSEGGAQQSQAALSNEGSKVSKPIKPLKNFLVEVPAGIIQYSTGPRFFTDWQISQFKQPHSQKSIDLESVTHQTKGQLELAFDLPEYAYLNAVIGDFLLVDKSAGWTYEDENVKLTREFSSAPGVPYLKTWIKAVFKNKKPNYAFLSLFLSSHEKDEEAMDRKFVYSYQNTITRLTLGDIEGNKDIPGPIDWIGAQSRYFLFSIVPENKGVPTRALTQSLSPTDKKISLVYPVDQNTFEIPLKVFFGAKEGALLKSVEPGLEQTVDFGWFTFVAKPILWLLKWIQQFVKNWGVAIIILTILIKLATYPLTLKGAKGMQKMAAMSPKLKEIQEKHKEDKEALNREMLVLMKSGGYNPLAGCMPMLLQMPIFFALYRVLYSSTELYQKPFVGWIHDLSVKDPLFITPILLTGVMWIQQKLTPTSPGMDPAQAKMMQYLPLIFGVMMISLPAGLTIYMLTNAVVGIIQQKYINKMIEQEKLKQGIKPNVVVVK
jgi:YidC/Oxa1 family membrane protein insertase